MTKREIQSPTRGRVLGANLGADHQPIPMMGKSMGAHDAAMQSLVAKRAANLASSPGHPGKKTTMRILGHMLRRASQSSPDQSSPESEPPSRQRQMERKLRLAGREPRCIMLERFRMLIRWIPIWCYPCLGWPNALPFYFFNAQS